MKQVITTAALVSALALGLSAPVQAGNDEAGIYDMKIYMEMLLNKAMDGNPVLTADPRGMSYDAYMKKEGEAAKGIITHFSYMNDSSTAAELDELSDAVMGHLVNSAETWMKYNPDRVKDLSAEDWVKLEQMKAGNSLTADEVDALVERGLAGYRQHNPDG